MTEPTEPPPSCAAVILAAGRGTRMRSALPKVLHPVAGRPMVAHVLAAAAAANPFRTVLVVSPDLADLPERFGCGPGVVAVVQDEPRGTGDALRQALPATAGADLLLVFFADHPELDGDTVVHLRDAAATNGARLTLLTVRMDEGHGYGRLDRDATGRPRRVVERKDDDPAKRAGRIEANSGSMAIAAGWAAAAVPRLTPSPATGEIYLTELVELAVADGPTAAGAWPVAALDANPRIALGVNDRVELARADANLRRDIRERLMRSGVTLVGPETIFVDAGVVVDQDTTILPFSVLSGETVVGRDCTIGPHAVLRSCRLGDGVRVEGSTLEACAVGDGSDVGPYAHLRAGTEVGPGVHVGNYAEVKNSRLGAGVRVGHFSYLGDAEVGPRVNVGAGTITANYDGERKHQTRIGADAFIGSDTILRAPVAVGAGARTGAGSVVTKDVPAGATVVGVPARVVRRAGTAGDGGDGEASVVSRASWGSGDGRDVDGGEG